MHILLDEQAHTYAHSTQLLDQDCLPRCCRGISSGQLVTPFKAGAQRMLRTTMNHATENSNGPMTQSFLSRCLSPSLFSET